MEYKEFLRKNLLNNEYGIYGKILEVYREQITFLKAPSLFRNWLADELEVPIEKINLNSLNSVLKRQRKKKGLADKEQPGPISSQADHSRNKTGNFKFSTPSSNDEKESRIKEW